jgi:hypothetical protein
VHEVPCEGPVTGPVRGADLPASGRSAVTLIPSLGICVIRDPDLGLSYEMVPKHALGYVRRRVQTGNLFMGYDVRAWRAGRDGFGYDVLPSVCACRAVVPAQAPALSAQASQHQSRQRRHTLLLPTTSWAVGCSSHAVDSVVGVLTTHESYSVNTTRVTAFPARRHLPHALRTVSTNTTPYARLALSFPYREA